LYVTGLTSGNVLRRPLRPDNALGLPDCVQTILGNSELTLDTPRALAADGSGNVYVTSGSPSSPENSQVVWLRPYPVDPTEVVAQRILSADDGLLLPQATAVDRQGNVYVSGAVTNNVFRIRTVAAAVACGNGQLDEGEACDYRLSCCCSLSCTPQPAWTICRDAEGNCDLQDNCDGSNPACVDQRICGVGVSAAR
jgi:hypothetical protein